MNGGAMCARKRDRARGASRVDRPVTCLSPVLLLAITVLLTGCNFVLYDEALVAGATFADELEQDRVMEWDPWESYGEYDEILVPDIFYPDNFSSDSGWLLDREGDFVIYRVQDGRVIDHQWARTWVPSGGDTGWNAWVVPVDPSLEGSGVTAPLFIGVWGEGDQFNLRIVTWDEPTESISETPVDLGTLTGGLGDVIAASVMSLQANDTGGTTAASSIYQGAMLQVLAEDTVSPGEYTDYYFVGSADSFDPANLEIGLPGALSVGQATSPSTIELPARADGIVPQHIRYAAATYNSTSVISFQTSPDRNAPWDVRVWNNNTGGFTLPQHVGSDGPVELATIGNSVRFNRTGTSRLRRDIGLSEDTDKEDLGSLWYAGQYPSPSGDMREVYTQTHVSQDGRRFVIAQYSRSGR